MRVSIAHSTVESIQFDLISQLNKLSYFIKKIGMVETIEGVSMFINIFFVRGLLFPRKGPFSIVIEHILKNEDGGLGQIFGITNSIMSYWLLTYRTLFFLALLMIMKEAYFTVKSSLG